MNRKVVIYYSVGGMQAMDETNVNQIKFPLKFAKFIFVIFCS